MRNYPTKDEILTYIQDVPPEPVPIAIVKEWKSIYYTKIWKSKPAEQKQEALEWLIHDLWHWLGHPDELHIVWTNEWTYDSQTNIITGDAANLSIISALHELGHALFGHSELIACGFSIGLFSMCFPREYSRLEWDGHMLRKPTKS